MTAEFIKDGRLVTRLGPHYNTTVRLNAEWSRVLLKRRSASLAGIKAYPEGGGYFVYSIGTGDDLGEFFTTSPRGVVLEDGTVVTPT